MSWNSRTLSEFAFWSLLAFLFVAFPVMSHDFYMTYDEDPQQLYGQAVFGYFNPGSDHFLEETKLIRSKKIYGGLFQVLVVSVQKLFPERDVMSVRHAVTALVSWIGYLAAGLLARRLFGTWAGVIAVALLVLSPRYLGHSMNNPKDLPLATTYILGVYALSFIGTRYPYVTWRSGIACVLATALCINIRPGGILGAVEVLE